MSVEAREDVPPVADAGPAGSARSGLAVREATAARSGPVVRPSLAARTRRIRRAISGRLSSTLTRRILLVNLGGLAALLIGFLYLNQLREGLIDARVQSLQTQGEIIAAAIAASATVETDAITLDPDKLLELLPGQSYSGREDNDSSLEFSINPERIGPVLRRLVTPTRTRARVYDRDGYLLLDSLSLADRSTILQFDLPHRRRPMIASPAICRGSGPI